LRGVHGIPFPGGKNRGSSPGCQDLVAQKGATRERAKQSFCSDSAHNIAQNREISMIYRFDGKQIQISRLLGKGHVQRQNSE
jgi:hypothetical protein